MKMSVDELLSVPGTFNNQNSDEFKDLLFNLESTWALHDTEEITASRAREISSYLIKQYIQTIKQ